MNNRIRLIRRILLIGLIIVCVPVACLAASAATSVKLDNSKLTVNVGAVKTIQLKNAKAADVKWKSSDKKIATVSKDGNRAKISAKKAGKCTITATYKGKKYNCKLTVKKKETKKKADAVDPPLSLNDFKLPSEIEKKYGTNIVQYLDEHYSDGWGVVFFYNERSTGKNKFFVTYRGVRLGDTKDKVIKLYGKGDSGSFDKNNDYRYDTVKSCETISKFGKKSDLSAYMKEDCSTYIRYRIDNKHRISFYFNSNDELTWVFYELNEP